MSFLRKLLRRRPPRQNTADYYRGRIDRKRFRDIHDKYVDADPHPGFSKYLEFDRWIQTAQSHYDLLQIDPERRISILDIGTGAGYFPFVCQQHGHFVLTLDVPGHDFYTDMTGLLGLNRRELFVKAKQSLPDFGQRFDLVTAFAICFNNHATEDLWDVDEWKFFISDLMTNVLTDDGRLFMKFNPEPCGEFFNDDIATLFASYDAVIEHDKVIVTQNGFRNNDSSTV